MLGCMLASANVFTLARSLEPVLRPTAIRLVVELAVRQELVSYREWV